MKRTILSFQAVLVCLLVGCKQTPESPRLQDEVRYVDPFIGTGFHGYTFPGTTRPYAMVQLNPDTHILGWDTSSGYHYNDGHIYGFSYTHLSGTDIGDLGDVVLLPFSDGDFIKPVVTFKKNTEKATPGYYVIRLDNFGINVELTSTGRVGFHKYTYDNPKERRVLLDLGHILQSNWRHKLISNQYSLVSDSTVEGTMKTQGWTHFHSMLYRVTFSESIETAYQHIGGRLHKDSLFLRPNTVEDLKFHYKFAEKAQPLYVKVALSVADPEDAKGNLEAELPGWDFDKTREESTHTWNGALNLIRIEADPEAMVNFYTTLYHIMTAPFAYQDVDGRYLDIDKKVHTAEPGYVNYSVFSLWDTFHTPHSLVIIINPDLTTDRGRILVQGYKEGGILSKWPLASSYIGCMVGYPAVLVLAGLIAEDSVEDDMSTWVEAGVRSSVYRENPAEKFKGTRELDLTTIHPYYKEKYGFIPVDPVPESVSWGLEMAYEDWCIFQIAKKVGNMELANEYVKKVEYYKRYLDPETKMMRPVMGDGSFRTLFNLRYPSHMKSDYAEGNAFQWNFFAPHDMDNFIAAIGGKEELETRLDTLFTIPSQIDEAEAFGSIIGLIGQYAHGNESSHHMVYLYNWTDSSWKGQGHLDYIMQNLYTSEPDGIIGNEDCGQMSVRYVMSALGFYQVSPGIPVYTLGCPMVNEASMHVRGGTFRIVATNNNPASKYVKEVKLNGKVLETPLISHSDIINGGKLEFIITD